MLPADIGQKRQIPVGGMLKKLKNMEKTPIDILAEIK